MGVVLANKNRRIFKMNKCPNPEYDLECPYALSDDSPCPCIATQEECDAYYYGEQFPVDVCDGVVEVESKLGERITD